jgi:CubicO group peptidase (beta-lactamase class C family)
VTRSNNRAGASVEMTEQLQECLACAGVTGASFAYWDASEFHEAVAGVRNSITLDPVTSNAVMHIGSITKVFTATLVMQLVDDELIELDDPVLKHLPSLRLKDRSALEAITCKMLINHTSGINCSMMPDRGPDQERIVDAIERCAKLEQLFFPGEIASYCNIGTVIAGYLAQELRRESWYTLIKERIFAPLEMRHALVDLSELPRFQASVGDLTAPSGKLLQTTRPFLPLSFAPAGTTAMMSSRDLVSFARALINAGLGTNGARILSQESARLMAAPTAALVLPADWKIGLGWMIRPGDVLTHRGGGPGVYSVVAAHPESGRTLALLCNSDNAASLEASFIEPLIASWTGPQNRPQPEPPGKIVPELFEGVYRIDPYRAEVIRFGDGLALKLSLSNRVYDNSPIEDDEQPLRMRPTARNVFEVEGLLPRGGKSEIRFVPGPDGKMRFLAPLNAHLLARVTEPTTGGFPA